MKDEFGIEVKCENCIHKGLLLNLPNDCSYCPNLIFVPSTDAYESRIAKLQAENALLKESRFTNNELNLICNNFQEQIREDKCGWSAEKRIIAKCNELLKERKD